MAKFRYRMQSILNVKEKLESQARNDFAVATARVNEEEEKLNRLVARKEEYERRLKGLVEDSLKIAEIKEAEDNVEVMKYHISLQQVNVRAAYQQLEVARQRLTAAMQDRKTHEKLKEKQFEAFRKEEAAKESKEIDELVSFKYGEDK